ncbi:Survival protein SurE-like phosphatase/nucleotidase [Zea mays]|uniref:Survival protein SurE-like phosphatase/nucleotidase n=1 Tax=Zea mays TaxID=4577 RepID=A0A1D6G334_MAIZE|nr:Survival protein SurE-like phosphatase/nucleotidase [Zea mays]
MGMHQSLGIQLAQLGKDASAALHVELVPNERQSRLSLLQLLVNKRFEK